MWLLSHEDGFVGWVFSQALEGEGNCLLRHEHPRLLEQLKENVWL